MRPATHPSPRACGSPGRAANPRRLQRRPELVEARLKLFQPRIVLTGGGCSLTAAHSLLLQAASFSLWEIDCGH